MPRFTSPAYAIEQTYQALQNVRFLHITARDETGQINDERWIEIGMDGYQIRYRQQNPLSPVEEHPGEPEMVIHMANRRRLVSGQNFGYDPNGTPEENEAAIAAWEQWLVTDGAIRFTPDADLLEIPDSAPTIR